MSYNVILRKIEVTCQCHWNTLHKCTTNVNDSVGLSLSSRDALFYRCLLINIVLLNYLFLRNLKHKPCCVGEEWNVKEGKCKGECRLCLHLA